MLTTVQRQLAALKMDLLREANSVPAGFIDQLNVAVAHLNDAAGIIQGVCMQVEPDTAELGDDAIADKNEIAELRREIREMREDRDSSRKQPADEPQEDVALEPVEYDAEPQPQSVLDADATTEVSDEEGADLIPVVDPASATAPIRDRAHAAREQAVASGRQEQENTREGDPPEQGWG